MSIRKIRYLAKSVVCGLSALAVLPAAHAQVAGADAGDEIKEVVITGSRIARDNSFDVANPIVTLTADQIEGTGQINITNILLRNPALSASVGDNLSGGRDAAFGQTGANLLDLRNLGVDRTLVLVNGKRHVPGLPNTAAVDINSIPQDLIERVDVLTGGASAVYGADGVSGVVNFIMKRNFEGLTVRAQTGETRYSDGGTQFVSAVGGKNFAADRGNVALSYEYTNSPRISSFDRPFSGDPRQTFGLFRDRADIPDDPNVPDRRLYNNLTWGDSAPDGAVDLDLDGVPDFTGSGLPYDGGPFIPASGGRADGGSSNTPVAGYFGDIRPQTRRHVANLLTSFEFSPAARLYADLKYAQGEAFSVGQPSFDFFTYLTPENPFLVQRFGAANTVDGALVSRDNFDFGIRGETIKRKTTRAVLGVDGAITDNLNYDVSVLYGETRSRQSQTSNLIGDRYYAALDAIVNPANGQIVCRSTLFPNDPIDPNNFGAPASTFTPGANSPCRPLNILGDGVASQAALDFVLAQNINRAKQTQQVVTGFLSGNLDSWFQLPGGSFGYAFGAEYREEKSNEDPDDLIENGEFRDFAAIPGSGGEFDVKEVFAEIDMPLLADKPFAKLLSVSAAVRRSDYSTIGKTTTWKVDGIWSPIEDIRFRASTSEAVRAPNIGELFQPATGAFLFVTDPCDITRLNDGTQFRAANCTTILSGLGLTPAQIAAFSPSTSPTATTSRRSTTGGNPLLQEETATTWTAGVVLRPRFLPNLTMSIDWYDIQIEDAVNTPSGTELAELCVDQPTVNNVFCDNVFRAQGTGFVLGDGNDPLRRIGVNVRPQNVADFRVAGADIALRYRFEPQREIGRFNFGVVAGYLDKITFIPSIGADPDDDLSEIFNPRWRGSVEVNWQFRNFNVDYSVVFQDATRRFTTEQLTANPDIAPPNLIRHKRLWDHSLRAAYEFNDRYTVYAGVNNLADQKPDFADFNYPISGVGRTFFFGAKAAFGQ